LLAKTLLSMSISMPPSESKNEPKIDNKESDISCYNEVRNIALNYDMSL